MSLLAIGASGQGQQQPIVIQTPAPRTAPAETNQDDAKVREALRKSLEGPGAPPPAGPAAPGVPAEPPIRYSPMIPTPAPGYSFYADRFTNALNTNVTTVQLSLREAIWLALEHNTMLQVDRYTPIISEYDRRGLYGYYDPVLSTSLSKSHSDRESGGFNAQTGVAFPSTKSDNDTLSTSIGGNTPTGMRYDIKEDIFNTDATSFSLDPLNTNQFKPKNTDTWNAQGTATLRQPLLKNFWIDGQRLAIQLKKRDVRKSEYDLMRTTMDIVNQVEKAYYNMAANRELVRVGEADVGVKKQQYEEQKKRVEVGVNAPLDEKLAQAELARSELNLVIARKNAADAEALLKSLMHDNFVNQLYVRIELSDRLMAIPVDWDLFEAFREAMEKRPDLKSQQLTIEKLQIQLKYDRNQLFPSLDLFGSFGLNGLDPHLGGALDDQSAARFPQYTYGLSFSFPLTFWAERNAYKSTQMTKAQEILRLKQLEEQIVYDIDFQIRLLRNTWTTIPLRREQTVYEQAALEAEQKKLAAGKSTSFNVLKIASDLTTAQSDEIGTLRDYNQAISELNFRKGTTLERWNIDRPTMPPRR